MLYLSVNYFYVSHFLDYKISRSTVKIRLNAQQIKNYKNLLRKLVEN